VANDAGTLSTLTIDRLFRSIQAEKVLKRSDLNTLFEFVFMDMQQEGRLSFYYATRQRSFQLRHLKDEKARESRPYKYSPFVSNAAH